LIDLVGDAYHLPFPNDSVSDLILIDVLHHLRYPGTALAEFHRVLLPGGRVIIFEPFVRSILGFIVYGLFHHESLGMFTPIQWFYFDQSHISLQSYYTAQANASRIFFTKRFKDYLSMWKVKNIRRFSALTYVLSGGYSGPQLFPDAAYPIVRFFDKICEPAPLLFATRLLLYLEKLSHQDIV
jgi:SAM-dependent methyltransferase